MADDPSDLFRAVGLDPPSLRRGDVVAATGVEGDRTIRWWRAMGFAEVPDGDVAFNALDVDLVARLGELVDADLLDDGDVLRLARLLGVSFQRITEAQLTAAEEVLSRVRAIGVDPGGRPDLLGDLHGDERRIMTLLERSITYVWQRHMIAALGRRTQADRAADLRAVGFADMAGFTRLSNSLEGPALAALIDRFESISFDVVAHSDGRVVKLIGDEVMFVAPTLVGAVDIALALQEQMGEQGDMPTLRCGLAVGPTVEVGGDVFGSTVNLASRLTAIAKPGAVLVPRDQAQTLDGVAGLTVRPVRRRYDLKGIGDTRVSTVGRAVMSPD
jgi:adenylate cyclase